MARVLVCGGRAYADRRRVFAVLDGLHQFGLTIADIVEGGASGADELARLWASRRGIGCITVKPDWAKYGKSAGPRRNSAMLNLYFPDLVVAFPGDKGTADMVSKAQKVGVEVLTVAAPTEKAHE